MFEIGWTEMLVIAIVMIVVVGPKDLPKMLRTFGKTVAKLRGMAGDFQKQFNEALKEAELDDVKKSIDEIRGLNPVNEIKRQLNPFEQAAADVRAGLDKAMKPTLSTSSEAASPDLHPAEPLKTGATGMPSVATPDAIPAPPPELVSAVPLPVSGVATPEPVVPKTRTAKPALAVAPVKAAPSKTTFAVAASVKAAGGTKIKSPATPVAKASAASATKASPSVVKAAEAKPAAPVRAQSKPVAAKSVAATKAPVAKAPLAKAKLQPEPPAGSKPRAAKANGVSRSGPAK